MPETTEIDGHAAREWIGKCAAAIKDVETVLHLVGTTSEQFKIIPGWFQDTFSKLLPDHVSLLHCDADWYDSVLLVLRTFYPRISNGGVVVLDDFGHWEGCREAFYDFYREVSEKPLLERYGTTQASWIKGKQHNRG
jgi:O-methyltransferase